MNHIRFFRLCFAGLFGDSVDKCAYPYFSPDLYPLPNIKKKAMTELMF